MRSNLLTISGCSDLFVDSFLADEENNLVFISVWARDTSILEFISRIELRDHEDGISKLIFVEELPKNTLNGINIPSGRIQKFKKISCRNRDSKIFGELVHTYIYDERISCFDYSSRSILCIRKGNESIDVWPLVKKYCHVPLMDSWKTSVLESFKENDLITLLSSGVGVNGISINLDQDIVEGLIEKLVCDKIVGL